MELVARAFAGNLLIGSLRGLSSKCLVETSSASWPCTTAQQTDGSRDWVVSGDLVSLGML